MDQAQAKVFKNSIEVSTIKRQPRNSFTQINTLVFSIIIITLSITSIGLSQTVTTSKTVFAPNEEIIVQYSGFPIDCEQCDWITVVSAGADIQGYDAARWDWISKANGSISFKGLSAGKYEARGYINWPNERYEGFRTNHKFTVEAGALTLETFKKTYASGESVFVWFEGLPGNKTDWITIVPVGTPDNSYGEWYYTDGKTEGSMQFTKSLAPGQYEARLYLDWSGTSSYTVQKRYAFSIQ